MALVLAMNIQIRIGNATIWPATSLAPGASVLGYGATGAAFLQEFRRRQRWVFPPGQPQSGDQRAAGTCTSLLQHTII